MADRAKEPPAAPRESYSPRLRTALILTGTGTAGAYHAGVLRGLHEAGVKIDLVAGSGIGAASALFAAIDGAARLWDQTGLWRSRAAAGLYPWRGTLRFTSVLITAAAAIVAVPLLALALAVVVYPIAFLLRLARVERADGLAAGYARLLSAAFEPASLPTVLPQLVVLVLAALVVGLAGEALMAAMRDPRRRQGSLWWRIVGAPISTGAVNTRIRSGLWHLIRGIAPARAPRIAELSRRYAELLAENLGQPGFRELLLTAHDLDARRDLVFALVAEPYRRPFFGRWPGGSRRGAEAIDLSGVGRDHVFDALTAALALPVVCEPHPITFAPESYWRGETHRLCARPGAALRLFEEAAAAGVEQVIVVSAAAELEAPHGLTPARGDGRGRLGELLAATDAAAVRDAIAVHAAGLRGVFLVRPLHNPIGPFDFGGAYDERSDRRQTLGELVDRGYEDVYRQFIEPVVGASGEALAPRGRDERAAKLGG